MSLVCPTIVFILRSCFEHLRTMFGPDLLSEQLKLWYFEECFNLVEAIFFNISYLVPCQGHIWIMLNPTLVKLPYKTTIYWKFSRLHQNCLMERAMEDHLWDHAQALFGPCWSHDWHILISRLSRALIVSRLSKFGPREMYIECQIFKVIA